MTANENNRRYLAEAWIDEDKDEEFKKSFLENLLNQIEHHKADGSGFDADMLDGKHYCEISKEIDEKVKGFLNDFSIGKVHISNENGSEYTLGFDAITLFPNVDGYDGTEKTLPWDNAPRETTSTLMEVFQEVYNMIESKADNDVFEETVSKVNSLEEDIGTLNGKISPFITGNEDDGYNINATTINGVQIYILSESAYARIPQSEKNDIRNVYIVKPDNEVDLSVYPDGVITNNTNVAEISRFYEFRVKEKENQETGVVERWLQYRYKGTSPEREEDETEEAWQIRDDATWNDMAKTSDFLDNDLIQSNVINYLSNGSYNLSPSAVKSAFQQIGTNGVEGFTKTDTSQPIQFLLQNFISGALYKDTEVPIRRDVLDKGNSQYLVLDSISTDIEAIIDNKIDEYWKKIYPIGAIYISSRNEEPETLFGGPWERIQGRFLLAATEGENSTYYAGKQDGAATVQLTTAQLPSHNHQHAHKHGKMDGVSYVASNNDIKVNIDNERAWTEKKKGGIHYVYAKVGKGKTKLTGIETKQTTGDATSTSTTSTGSNNPHNNMPPYLAVNVWRRTA